MKIKSIFCITLSLCFFAVDCTAQSEEVKQICKENIVFKNFKEEITSNITSQKGDFFLFGTTEGNLYMSQKGRVSKFLISDKPIQDICLYRDSLIALMTNESGYCSILIIKLKEKESIKQFTINTSDNYHKISFINDSLLLVLSKSVHGVYSIPRGRLTLKLPLPKFNYWNIYSMKRHFVLMADDNDTIYGFKNDSICKLLILNCNPFKRRCVNDSIIGAFCDSALNLIYFNQGNVSQQPLEIDRTEISYIEQISDEKYVIIFQDYRLVVFDNLNKKILKSIIFSFDESASKELLITNTKGHNKEKSNINVYSGVKIVIKIKKNYYIFDKLGFILCIKSPI